jgi:serine/threonine protein kinase
MRCGAAGPRTYRRASRSEYCADLDFGIAKMKEDLLEATSIGTTLTETGMAIGTPSYMSPEQAPGRKGDELDGRSDIWITQPLWNN